MNFNIEEAERFLQLLGKNGASRLRAFWPKHRPLQPGEPRALRGTFANDAREITSWIQRGLGVYVVIANGGDSDDAIINCPALFVEWDDRPKDEQINAWKDYGLPEPTFTVDTGGKSMHLYWVLNEPIDPERFRNLIGRLIAYTGADSTNRNPSRVMRLPGAWHFSYDKDAGKVRRNGQTTIVQVSGMHYDADLFDDILPLAGASPNAPAIDLSGDTLGDFPPRPVEAIYDAMAQVPEFHHDQDRYDELVKLAKRLHMELGRDDALQLLQGHSPHIDDMAQYFTTAPTRLSPGSLWPFLRDTYGIDIRRHDLKGQAPSSLGPTTSARTTATADATAQEPPTPGINPSLDLKQKLKRHTLAPDEVVLSLPQRLGGVPRLNIRTSSFHAGGKVYTSDDLGRIYIHFSSETERWPKETTADAFVELAKDRAFDPVEEELNEISRVVEPLPMEDWQRLDQRLLGIDDPIAAAFLPQFLLSAVARIYRPGCGVRRSPVLIGPQWRGKTRLGRILFGADHWIENVTDLGKDDLLRLQAGWGIELSELNGITRRKDQEALKAFLTATDDVYRVPYGKGVARYQRRCVFWGTANGPPLRDLSGSTRFVCIKIPDRMLPLDWAVENRDALWARALAIFRQIPPGQEPWDVSTEEERKAIEERNANHQEIDPWSDEIAKILAGATDRPVSIPYVLDRMDIPKGQRNNAMAARIRQLAECAGWVAERRWVGGERRQGLWPLDPFGRDSGHTDRHTDHTTAMPGGGGSNTSADEASDLHRHTGHPYSSKVDGIKGVEGDSSSSAARDGFGACGVAGAPNDSDPPPQLPSDLIGWGGGGVSSRGGGVSSHPPDQDSADLDDYDEFAD